MIDTEFRIIGRVTSKSNMNSFFPKFVVTGENTYNMYNNPEEMDDLPPNTRVFEPKQGGLGVTRELMYVETNVKTYLFWVSASGAITWGDELITFQESITFN